MMGQEKLQVRKINAERSPNVTEIRERSKRYEAQGISVEFARELPSLIESKFTTKREDDFGERHGYGHLESFYIRSSDSLEILKHVEVAGKHVVTVAGNSDFAKIFIQNGASQVDIFDISLPAVLYSEFCLVAIRELDFETCKRLLNSWDYGRNGESDDGTIFDPEIYPKLRPFLSLQAQEYFDELVKRPELLREIGSSPLYDFAVQRGVGRFYSTRNTGDIVIDGTIKNKTAYAKLQKSARTTPVSFTWASAVVLAEAISRAKGEYNMVPTATEIREQALPEGITRNFKGASVVYLSNIGYKHASQISLAKSFQKAGIKHVVFSMQVHEALGKITKSQDEFLTSDGQIVKNHGYNTEDREWIKKNIKGLRIVLMLDGRPIYPGQVLNYLGAKLKVIDYTNLVDIGLVVEMED